MNPAYPILFLALLLVGWGVFYLNFPLHGEYQIVFRKYQGSGIDHKQTKLEASLRVYKYWYGDKIQVVNEKLDYWRAEQQRDSILTKHGIK